MSAESSAAKASGNFPVAGNLSVSGVVSGYGTVPIGTIVMWSGSTVPDGWALCNGQTANGVRTPDLRNKFIVGAGDYNGDRTPDRGLAAARMLAHITYLSEESLGRKFGRNLQDKQDYDYDFDRDFAVESYLQHQGRRFVERFDADSYFYITRATDYFDLTAETGGDLVEAVKDVSAAGMIVSFSSDWLFPTAQSKRLADALLRNRREVTFCEIKSGYGHDAFLLEVETLGRMVRDFLRHQAEAEK